MVWLLASEEELKAIETLHRESDRSAAIVAAAIVDTKLTSALIAFLHKNQNITGQFFRTSWPLGSFANKIDLALLIGLCGRELHRELITMKDIRNAFAHSISVTDFNTQRIADLTKNFRLIESCTAEESEGSKKEKPPYPVLLGVTQRAELLSLPRGRYLLSARVFIAAFDSQRDCRMPEPWF